MTTPDAAVQPLMSIGMFSRASLLSVRALRKYHDQNILVPASIDPQTGYRAYHPSQLSDAAVLRRLRELDLPLAQVREVLVARDPEVTAKVLAQHQHVMQERLRDVERIVGDIQQAVDNPAEASPVHVRQSDHSYALATSTVVSADQFATFLDTAFASLFGTAMGHFTLTGPGGALYTSEIHDHETEPVTAFVPVAEPGPIGATVLPTELIELPQLTFAVAVHRGDYDTMGDSYSALGAWVAYNATPTSLPLREHYLASPADTDDPAEFRTEIWWPIEAAESPIT